MHSLTSGFKLGEEHYKLYNYTYYTGLHTNACETAICIISCDHCSILTGTFIKCSINIITTGPQSTDVKILCAFIDVWLKKQVTYDRITRHHTLYCHCPAYINNLTPTNACETAICISSCDYCSILT